MVHDRQLIGYAPLVEAVYHGSSTDLIRAGNAVSMTVPEQIKGFRGYRYRWWDRATERDLDEEAPERPKRYPDVGDRVRVRLSGEEGEVIALNWTYFPGLAMVEFVPGEVEPGKEMLVRELPSFAVEVLL